MLDSFPQEIIDKILLRLPTKSLIRCTSVCKTWRSWIMNQSFIHSHHSRTISFGNQNDIPLLLLHSAPYVRGFQEVHHVYYDNQDFREFSKIEFPMALKPRGFRNHFLRAVGICNGLVCLALDYRCYDYEFLIWNPLIRKSVTLPEPGFTDIPYEAAIGFGFDAMTADYKVVRVVADPEDPRTVAEVYSLATGSWRSLGSVTPVCDIRGGKAQAAQAFVNGALHWPVFRTINCHRCYFILRFDVGSELFCEILMPKSITWSQCSKLAVSEDRKSIALFNMDSSTNDPRLNIWVMKEYCIPESWMKLISLGRQSPERLLPWEERCFAKALCFRHNGEVLLMLHREQWNDSEISKYDLVSLDLESKQLTNLGISGYPYCFVDSYEESLFLLDKTEAVSY